MSANKPHIGQNIRKVRLLRGMKQETFAKALGIAQQNVSKMENKEYLTDERIAQAAKVLQTTVEAIKELNENSVIQNNFLNEQAGYINQKINPLEKIVELYDRLISSKDNEIESLKAEISSLRNGTDINDNVKSIKKAR